MVAKAKTEPWWNRVWCARKKAMNDPHKYCDIMLHIVKTIKKQTLITPEETKFMRHLRGYKLARKAFECGKGRKWSDDELKAVLKKLFHVVRLIKKKQCSNKKTSCEGANASDLEQSMLLAKNSTPPMWLSILSGVESLTTTNAAPIKRVVLEAMKLGAETEISQGGMQRLQHAMTSMKKGGSYQFNNGRALKQTVLSVISAHVHTAGYTEPVLPIKISLSDTKKRVLNKDKAIDKDLDEKNDWRYTLGTISGMISNNSNPIKARVRLAIHQAEGDVAIQDKMRNILKCTPCETNSCSMLKKEIGNLLKENTLRKTASNTSSQEDGASAANDVAETFERIRPTVDTAPDRKHAVDHNPRLSDECVYLAAVSGDGRHEYCMKCDRSTMRKIFAYMNSLDTSEYASQKIDDANVPVESIETLNMVPEENVATCERNME
ncbi:hypothetical protein CYMTET_2995 [Cymbomonas tetramitiformis]|uniref:Uncharacterized protein n=1 Tax=Cymbomonas tetramitiformis TaxID=36881 RepID=A0AAE0H433_9CHLO|nr:hypothetical protein CYMTET_2995 [Cymbomonas tetramitiformis]